MDNECYHNKAHRDTKGVSLNTKHLTPPPPATAAAAICREVAAVWKQHITACTQLSSSHNCSSDEGEQSVKCWAPVISASEQNELNQHIIKYPWCLTPFSTLQLLQNRYVLHKRTEWCKHTCLFVLLSFPPGISLAGGHDSLYQVVYISDISPKSAAAVEGTLRALDLIHYINGISTQGMSLKEAKRTLEMSLPVVVLKATR